MCDSEAKSVATSTADINDAAEPSIAPIKCKGKRAEPSKLYQRTDIGSDTEVAEMLMLHALFKKGGAGPHAARFMHNVEKLVSPLGNGSVERNLFWDGVDESTWGKRYLTKHHTETGPSISERKLAKQKFYAHFTELGLEVVNKINDKPGWKAYFEQKHEELISSNPLVYTGVIKRQKRA